MSAQELLPFSGLKRPEREQAKQALQEYLLTQWRENAFRRVVQLDKVQLVNRGESPYFTRLYLEDGTAQELGTGYYKGRASPGMWMKFTQHHPVAYISQAALYRGLHDAGYRLTDSHRTALQRDGQAFLSNGMSNRLAWVMPINKLLKELLIAAGQVRTTRAMHEEEDLKEGDYLLVDDHQEKVERDDWTSYQLRIEVRVVRSAAYADERFRYLDTLS